LKAEFRLPAATWRGLMDLYHPNGVWLRLRKDVFESLDQYRSRHALPTPEHALERCFLKREGPVGHEP